MSFEAMTWAVKAKTENAGQKLVLLLLANHANGHTGQCNPSHKLLAEECCMGVSTLKNHIAKLEELGFLAIHHRAMEGISLPNQYTLKVQGGGSDFGGMVGQNLAGGGSDSGRGVGQNLATNQEDKPGIEPGIEPRESTPRKRSAPAARNCPASFEVTADMLAWAAESTPLADVELSTASFRDHTFKTAVTDWPGAWRNWLRRDHQQKAERTKPAPRRLPPKPENFSAVDYGTGRLI